MKKTLAWVVALNIAGAVFAAEKPAFNVLDFGAKGDGATKDTAAIQKALNTCTAAGGGTVLLPEGVFLTGSLVVGANTTLQLSSRANVLGSPDIADYPVVNVRWEGEFHEGHRALISNSFQICPSILLLCEPSLILLSNHLAMLSACGLSASSIM